jgi:hypothetical protein
LWLAASAVIASPLLLQPSCVALVPYNSCVQNPTVSTAWYDLLRCRAVNYYIMHTLQEWAALPQWLPAVYKAETGL